MTSMFKKALVLGSSQQRDEEVTVVVDEGVEYVFYDAVDAALHPDASPDGGVLCTDKEVMERQKSAVVDIMKSLGKKLLTGKFDLLKISLPVKIFEPRSYLQKLCDPLAFPKIIHKAVVAETPEERLKWVVTYFVAGYHRAFLTWSKPFNPILGETWHASLPDGTQAFMEQISHHPPISAFQIIGPGKSYYFHGHSQPTVTYKTNGITSYAVGERQIEFLDGTVIDVSFPEYNVRNIVSTSTTRADVSGKVDFIDRNNGLVASLQIGKVAGRVNGLLGRPDAVSGTMYRTKSRSDDTFMDTHVHPRNAKHVPRRSVSGRDFSLPMKKGHTMSGLVKPSNSSNDLLLGESLSGNNLHIPIASCVGNWLAYLDWDDTRYWTLSEDLADEWQEMRENALPSDCSQRDDLKFLTQGDLVKSQEAKDRMENSQRQDAKNRPVPT